MTLGWSLNNQVTAFADQRLTADLAKAVLAGPMTTKAGQSSAAQLSAAGFTPITQPEKFEAFLSDVIRTEAKWHAMGDRPILGRSTPRGSAGEAHTAAHKQMLIDHNHRIAMSPEDRSLVGQQVAKEQMFFAQKIAFELRDRFNNGEGKLWGDKTGKTLVFFAPFVTDGSWPTANHTSISSFACAVTRADFVDDRTERDNCDLLSEIFNAPDLQDAILVKRGTQKFNNGERRWEFRRPSIGNWFHIDGVFSQPSRGSQLRAFRAKAWARRPNEVNEKSLQSYLFAANISNMAGM